MRDLSIAYADCRQAKRWTNTTISYKVLKDRLRVPVRTAETADEYSRMNNSDRSRAKDHGGFVAGILKDGIRRADTVESRSMIVLDADRIKRESMEKFEELMPYTACLYTTHSSTHDVPRARIVIPSSRDVSPEEYTAVARILAQRLGIEQFDDCSYRPNQLMYWPSCPSDGEFIFRETDKEWLDPDVILAAHPEWTDPVRLPTSFRENVACNRRKAADPLSKDGIVGAFNRAYFPVTSALTEYLADVYEPSDKPDRWHLIGSDSAPGVVIYDDRFVYSNHATDIAYLRMCSSFDIVRLHKFHDMDEKASIRAMCELASDDHIVKIDLLKTMKKDQDIPSPGLAASLTFDKNGKLENSLNNIRAILENDENLKGIVFNQLADSLEISGSIPWDPPSRFWRDVDDAQLMCYMAEKYVRFSRENLNIALSKVADDRAYHPVKEYFGSLPEWDGTPRIETMLTDHFGASDDPYVRAVSRKMMCAAVMRVFTPGLKFDHILVLNGPQGIGKSTFIARLGMEWYSDSLSISDMNDKTAAEKLQGNWIMEISELAGMRKTDIDKVKAFISRQDDKYRASFARRVTSHPRQCVFFGTTNNDDGFLRDVTGNRRFWVVRTPGTGMKKPWDLSQADVDMIWAEALYLVRNGEDLYLDKDLEKLAGKAQAEAMEHDDRIGMVAAYLDLLLPENWDDMEIYERLRYLQGRESNASPVREIRNTVSNMEIWVECFCRNRDELTKSESFSIRSIMECIPGWKRTNKQITLPIYGKQRIYERTISDAASEQSPDLMQDRYQPAAQTGSQQMKMQELAEFGTEFDPDVVPF